MAAPALDGRREISSARVIHERPPFRIEVDDRPSSGLVELLRRAEWGSRGLRYRNPHPQEDFRHLADASWGSAPTTPKGAPSALADASWGSPTTPKGAPFGALGASFFSLCHEDEVVGAYVVERGQLLLGQQQVTALFRRLLTIDPRFAGGGWARQMRASAMEDLLPRCGPCLSFGFVEADNQRMHRVALGMGAEALRALEIVATGWLAPADDPDVTPLLTADVSEVVTRLERLYEDHVRTDLASTLDADSYWVVRDGPRIKAGVQASRKTIDITRFGGLFGRVLVPVARSLSRFHPALATSPRSSLVFSHILCEPGAEDTLARLMETLVGRASVSGGLMYLDRGSPLSTRLLDRDFRRFGGVRALAPKSWLQIIGTPHDLPDSVFAELRSRPFVFMPHLGATR